MKLRDKLLLSLLAMTLLPLIVMNKHAFDFFHDFNTRSLEQDMIRDARNAALLLEQLPKSGNYEAALFRLSELSDSRIRLLYHSGEWGFDTEPQPEDRYELKEERAQRSRETGSYSANWALSKDSGRLFYFVNLPTGQAEHEVAVVQVIRHTGAVTKALLQLRVHQRSSAWISGIAAIFIALLLAWVLTRRLKQLRKAARRYAAEGAPALFHLKGRDEIAELAHEFERMAQEIGEQRLANQEFVQSALHELKSPITGILGAVSILQEHPDLSEAERSSFLNNIEIQSTRLEALALGLQALSRLESELPSEAFEDLDLISWLEEVSERLRHSLQVDLRVLPPENGGTLHLQPARIEQALANLLQNAERVQPDRQPLILSCRKQGASWELSVEDQGPGIPEEHIGRIFEQFFTTLPRNHSGQQGQGLGLAIVKRIVEEHQGSCFAINRPEGGAQVGFSLPG